MNTTSPPRLALALLRHVAWDNEPFVGDLVEQFAVKRSRIWFWRQTLAAIAVSLRQRGVDVHPLHLSDETHERVPRALPRRVNLSASPLPDVGGLGLVVLVVIVATVRPETWWMALPAIVGGAILGVVLVVARRHRIPSHSATGRTLID